MVKKRIREDEELIELISDILEQRLQNCDIEIGVIEDIAKEIYYKLKDKMIC